jgi:hypothetical protein
MVEKMMQIKGTIIKMTFSKLSKPLAVLSSRLNTLRDIANKRMV